MVVQLLRIRFAADCI